MVVINTTSRNHTTVYLLPTSEHGKALKVKSAIMVDLKHFCKRYHIMGTSKIARLEIVTVIFYRLRQQVSPETKTNH